MSEYGFDVAALDERLASIVRGRRVIVMSTVAAAATESNSCKLFSPPGSTPACPWPDSRRDC